MKSRARSFQSVRTKAQRRLLGHGESRGWGLGGDAPGNAGGRPSGPADSIKTVGLKGSHCAPRVIGNHAALSVEKAQLHLWF